MYCRLCWVVALAAICGIALRANAVQPDLPEDGERDQVDQVDSRDELRRGKVAFSRGETEAAMEHFRKAATQPDYEIPAHAILAQLHIDQKQWAEAIPHLEAVLRPDAELSELGAAFCDQRPGFEKRMHLELVRARLQLLQWEAAQVNLQTLKNSEWAPAAWYAVIFYFRYGSKEQEKANLILKNARHKYAEDPGFALLAAENLMETEDEARATSFARKFAVADPDDPTRKLGLMAWHLWTQTPDRAVRVLAMVKKQDDEFRKRDRETLSVLHLLMLYDNGQFAEAESAAAEMLTNPSLTALGYAMQARLAMRAGDKLKASELLRKAHRRILDPARDIVRIRFEVDGLENQTPIKLQEVHPWIALLPEYNDK